MGSDVWDKVPNKSVFFDTFPNIPKEGEFTHSDLLSMFLSSGTQILEEDLKLSKPEQEHGHILPNMMLLGIIEIPVD